MIVLGGRRGCGCGGCLTVVALLFFLFLVLPMINAPARAPGRPIHPVYPATATPTSGGGFSDIRQGGFAAWYEQVSQ